MLDQQALPAPDDDLLTPEDRLLLAQVEPPKAWEQQPEESSSQFGAFCVYRDLGPRRTLTEVSKRWYGRKMPNGIAATIHAWSKRFHWRSRAQAWDAELDRIRREDQQRRIIATNARHFQLADAMIDKAAQRITTMDPRRIAPKDIPTWVTAATKIQRGALGMADQTVQQQVTGPGGGPIQVEHSLGAEEEEIDARLRELLRESGRELRSLVRSSGDDDPLAEEGGSGTPGEQEEAQEATFVERDPAGDPQ